MAKPSKPGSGKDRGSLTQKADSQEVRISQVSNVSKAVNAMGKETTRRMKETDRKIAEGGDSQEIAGSMNSVLNSLKTTVDSLNRGVEAATLGTAKAAQEAISQYGQAISEDFKINRQNMVASALSTSTPIFGYFASKFMETGMFKKTKDKMSDSISNIFKKKSKGGSLPDEFDMDDDGSSPGKKLTPAQAAEKARINRDHKKKDGISAMKVANQEKYEKYDKPTEQKMLVALTAIQGAVGATIGKFSQWYDKLLIEHPFYRRTAMAFKYLSAGAGGLWKAAYFIWRPRGGYKKHLSKAKNPFQAINQNLGALFVQTMPRLDAIMIYTKATAIAMRDLSSHVTGKRYPMMDPSKLGGTWSIGGVAMAIMRGAGRLAMKGARKLRDSMYDQGTKGHDIFSGMIEGTESIGKIADYGLTGPGRMKDWVKGKTLDQLPGAKEKRRMFSGLEGTEGGPGGFGKQESPCVRICPETDGILGVKHEKKMRLPKTWKQMGRRLKPDIITQGVFDEFFAKQIEKSEKRDRKLLGYTAKTTDELKEHNSREKRRSLTGIIGGIFGGIKDLFGGAMGLLGGLFGGGGGMKGILTGLAMNPAVWKATGIVGLIVGGFKLQEWLDNKFKDSDSIMGSVWRGYKTAFPGVDMGLAVKEGVMGGISRMFKGEPFDWQTVVKESVMGWLDRTWKNKFGVGAGSWWKVVTGQASDKEKQEFYDNQMQKQFGDDKYAMELKARRIAEAKGIKEKGKAWWDYAKGYTKSKLGMDHDESELAITALKAEKLVKKYGGQASDYMGLKYDQAVAVGKKIYAEAKAKADIATKEGKVLADKTVKVTKKIALVTTAEATRLANEYGGHAREYLNKNYPDAVAHGEKLQERALAAKDYIVDKAKQGSEITIAKAKELSDKYGGKPEEYLNMTLDQAKKYGEKIKNVNVKEKLGESKNWFSKQWDAMKKWAGGDSPKDTLKKTGEFIEIGKGNFLELYRQGTGNIKEMWETATPEKKAWIRQNAERLLASGQITAEELKKMGIQIKDATLEGAEKVGNAVVTSAVNTTNNISNAVSNMQTGGGFGGGNKFMQEQTMDDISRGHVDY